MWRPVTCLPARNSAPAGGARLVLNGLLVQGSFELNGPLDFALQHCTLVPGRRLNEDGSPRLPDRDSLTVNAASSELQVTIDDSIVGPLRLPALSRSLTIRDSIVHAPQAVGRAVQCVITAVVSGGG